MNPLGRRSLLLPSGTWSQGSLSIFPEFILYAWSTLKSWLCDFLSSCMHQLKIPKIWRRALIVAIPKPEKPPGNPKSYRPISLLCVLFEILKRLIYARVESLLPREQAVFRHGRSTVDQVTLLTQDIEDNFSAKKAGAVFVDLTAAYDIIWHRGSPQGRSQEFCLGGASRWRRQISNFSYFAQRSFWCHWSIATGYDVRYLLPVGIDKF